jgi:hypothetical protein
MRLGQWRPSSPCQAVHEQYRRDLTAWMKDNGFPPGNAHTFEELLEELKVQLYAQTKVDI